jgi:hypothetical protein
LKTHLTPRDLALTLAVVAVLGYTFVPVKVALREVPPFTLAAVRFVLAALPMVFFVRRQSMPLRGVIAYGLAIGVFQFGFMFLGIKLGMPVGLASLVIQMQVFFTIGSPSLSPAIACAATTSSPPRSRSRESSSLAMLQVFQWSQWNGHRLRARHCRRLRLGGGQHHREALGWPARC